MTAPKPALAHFAGFPPFLFVNGDEQRNIAWERNPFTIGRRTDKDLVIADPRVSRDHAEILAEGDAYYLVDLGSKHGTFVNGERVQRRKLSPEDKIEFGLLGASQLIFDPQGSHSSTAREFLSQVVSLRRETSDLEKLTLFLQAARELNTSGAVDEVFITLIEATLRFTGAERGFVFLRDDDGKLRLAAGRTAKGQALVEDRTISHSILEEAALSASEFMVSDALKSSHLANRESIVAHDLRTVICIPLRRRQVADKSSPREPATQKNGSDVLGMLYLDSRIASGDISGVNQQMLSTIATEAAALVENARLVQSEQAARRYEQELSIASSIQQRLMTVTIPDVPFAKVRAKNIACKDVGGDFFDVVVTDQDLSVVLADVCGKGVSAALLASILQGMIYSQLVAGLPLPHIVSAVNRFLCQKKLGEKYATLFIARVNAGGALEYINCGHLPPLLRSGNTVTQLKEANLPVGLFFDSKYEGASRPLTGGNQLFLFTDGVTEAEDGNGEFFGYDRLETSLSSDANLDDIFAAVRSFCGPVPLSDDCTLLELTYAGSA